jgi:hypothetical protein
MGTLRISMAGVLLLATVGSYAHHSAAMFDRTKKVTISGTVAQFQYVQPHSWIDVKTIDAEGKETTWAFEGGAPMQMKMVGLTPDVLKVGDKITITGHPLRDGRSAAAFLELTLPSGKVVNTKPPAAAPKTTAPDSPPAASPAPASPTAQVDSPSAPPGITRTAAQANAAPQQR